MNKLKGKCRLIVVNTSYKLAPWADVLYGCDRKWWDWHPDAVDFKGIKVTMTRPVKDESIHLVRNRGTPGLSLHRDGLMTGRNGGYQAINLAVLLGAKTILLLGYDMKPKGNQVHWHEEHPKPTPKTIFKGFLVNYNTIVEPLKEQGVKVINCTPDSELKVFETMELDVAISRYCIQRPADTV